MAPKVEGKKKPNALLAGGTERGQAARWEHDDKNVGTTLLGKLVGSRVTKFKDGKEGSALIFSPAIVVDEKGVLTTFRQIETLHSASLATRINPAIDAGSVFGIEYTGTEPSEHKGRAPFKTFDIAEQAPALLAKFLMDEGAPELAALVERAQ